MTPLFSVFDTAFVPSLCTGGTYIGEQPLLYSTCSLLVVCVFCCDAFPCYDTYVLLRLLTASLIDADADGLGSPHLPPCERRYFCNVLFSLPMLLELKCFVM